jgi:hypothetical protein
MREEHRPNMFNNTVLWKIFGPESDEATGDGRRLHYEEFNL